MEIIGTLEKINFHPDSLEEEIIQNVKTILTTTKFSVPLDRNFGIMADALDETMPVAMAKLSADIVEAITLYEPRCKISQILFDGNDDGILIPRVRITI